MLRVYSFVYGLRRGPDCECDQDLGAQDAVNMRILSQFCRVAKAAQFNLSNSVCG